MNLETEEKVFPVWISGEGGSGTSYIIADSLSDAVKRTKEYAKKNWSDEDRGIHTADKQPLSEGILLSEFKESFPYEYDYRFLDTTGKKKRKFRKTSIDEDSGLYNYADGGELKDWKYKRFDEGWIDGEGYIKIVELLPKDDVYPKPRYFYKNLSQSTPLANKTGWKYKDKFEDDEGFMPRKDLDDKWLKSIGFAKGKYNNKIFAKGGEMEAYLRKRLGEVEDWSMGEFQTIRDWDSKITNEVRVYEDVDGYPVLKKNEVIYVYKTKKQAQEKLKQIKQRINKDDYADGGKLSVGGFDIEPHLKSEKLGKGRYKVTYRGIIFYVTDVKGQVEGTLTWHIGEEKEGEWWFSKKGEDALWYTKAEAIQTIKDVVDSHFEGHYDDDDDDIDNDDSIEGPDGDMFSDYADGGEIDWSKIKTELDLVIAFEKRHKEVYSEKWAKKWRGLSIDKREKLMERLRYKPKFAHYKYDDLTIAIKESLNRIDDYAKGGEIYDLRISLGKYGKLSQEDAKSNVIRDVFLDNQGIINKEKWDKTIKEQPKWKEEWQDFKEFSEIEIQNGNYINPYMSYADGGITKSQLLDWGMAEGISWETIEVLFQGKRSLTHRQLKDALVENYGSEGELKYKAIERIASYEGYAKGGQTKKSNAGLVGVLAVVVGVLIGRQIKL